MSILVTGGMGFIGSHICVELLNLNYNVIIIDNLSNSNINTFDKIKKITNNDNITFYNIDLLDYDILFNIFKSNNIDTIIHCAGLKAVKESIDLPLKYYNDNLNMTFNLLKLIKKFNINKFIFSSSATVYGLNNKIFTENDIIGQNITNPYGQTKYFQEVILKDFSKQNKNTHFVILRYFNPVGAHKSGLIGENPNGIPNNLMPYIIRVACNNNINKFTDEIYNKLTIFGKDYDTCDGTCERDFIHVVDLAKAHIKAIEYKNENNYDVFNIGTGQATSVLKIVNKFIDCNKTVLNYKFGNRRVGDPSKVTCDVSKANNILKWKSELSLDDMVKDSWNFASK